METMLEKIAKIQRKKIDFYQPIKNLSLRSDEEFQLGNNELTFSQNALSQLLTRFRIPGHYYRRCPIELKRTNLNYWLSHSSSELLFRIFQQISEEEVPYYYVRAIFSNQYEFIDDDALFPLVQLTLTEKPIRVHWLITDNFTYLHLSLWRDIKEKFESGVSICNSETGQSAVWIEPFINIESNYSLLSRKNGATRFIHRGQITQLPIQEAIREAIKTAQLGIPQLLFLEREQLSDPKTELKKIIQKSNIFGNSLLDALSSEEDRLQQISKLDFIRLILDQTKHLPIIEQFAASIELGRHYKLFSETPTDLFGELQ